MIINQLNIELHKQYVEQWAKMTRENIGKTLAIILDGKVLSFPMVHSEIIVGKLMISGTFANDEILVFQSIILGGELNCKAKIINK